MRRPFYVLLAVVGLVGTPVVLGVLFALSLAAGGPPPGLFGIPPLIVLSAIAGVLLLWTTRVLIPALVVSVLHVLAAVLLGSQFGLTHPESFFDFAGALTPICGALAAIIGSVGALVQRRRGKLGPARPRQRVMARAAAAIFAASLVASAFLTFARQPAVANENGTTPVDVRDDRFEPSELRVRAGRTYRILLRNDDPYAHTFSIDELAVDEYIGPLSERRINLTVDEGSDGATYELFCAVTGHERMKGRVDVTTADDG